MNKKYKKFKKNVKLKHFHWSQTFGPRWTP